jgi:REP element-mobilizing transposase RayT
MTTARSQIVVEGEVGVYHTQSRCVRRAFLCGLDEATGRNYEHRRGWVESRLAFVATDAFSVDILSFSILENHWHGVLRTRPDLAEELTDEAVARRWVRLFPGKRDIPPAMREKAFDGAVKKLLQRKRKLAKVRGRLSSLSWFMKAVNENIARRSNREDGVTGHFWESRFKCQALLDEAAILACMAYVDLNPVRAKMAEGLEDSRFTSAYDRIKARVAREEQAALKEMEENIHPIHVERIEADLKPELDQWLLSFDAPDFPISNITEDAYLQLLDITGRCIRSDKRGAIDPSVTPILEAVDINVANWVDGVEHYGTRTCRVVGHIEAIYRAAANSTVKFFKGRKLCEELFSTPIPAPG